MNVIVRPASFVFFEATLHSSHREPRKNENQKLADERFVVARAHAHPRVGPGQSRLIVSGRARPTVKPDLSRDVGA